MKISKIKAKITNDFANKWIEWCMENENQTRTEICESYPGIYKLSDRISNEIVDLYKYEYPRYETDYFEVIDNDYLIPSHLFEIIE